MRTRKLYGLTRGCYESYIEWYSETGARRGLDVRGWVHDAEMELLERTFRERRAIWWIVASCLDLPRKIARKIERMIFETDPQYVHYAKCRYREGWE
jgi:hypothetical protein